MASRRVQLSFVLALCAVGVGVGFHQSFHNRRSVPSPIYAADCSHRWYHQRCTLAMQSDMNFDEKQMGPLSSEDSLSAVKEPVKKIAKGSAPEFFIPDDSTVETNTQRALVSSHFLISAINLITALSAIHLDSPFSAAALAGIVYASTVLGDFGTGVFHWSVDNYGSINTPIVGTVCAAFQGHHQSPWTITFRSFVNNVYKISYGTIPALLLTAWFTNEEPFVKIFLTLFINWWMISQELHKYSHMREVPPIIKALQDTGLILSRKEHGQHHKSPFEGNYCILTGACNKILDESKFFRHLEKGVYRATGNRPICWDEDPAVEAEAMATTFFK